MADPRWADDTEDVLSRIAHQEGAPCKPCDHVGIWADDRETARAMLTWLAEEGLLLPPPGGEVAQQWGVRNVSTGHVLPAGSSEEQARVWILRAFEDDSQYLGLARRTVHRGPWVEVPDAVA